MERTVHLAERLCTPLLWAAGLANLAFALAFALTLLVTAGRAGAAECQGSDMLAEMRRTDPARLERIAAEAALTANGQGRLWRVERAGVEPSFLFGTMHVTDPRVLTLPPAAEGAFGAARTLVIETTDILDQGGMLAAIMGRPDLMMFTDDTTLVSLLTPEDREIVEKGLAARGLPLATVVKMKPWMLSAMVTLPACEMARKARGEPVLDVELANRARAAGKEIAGLETAVSQLEAMASLPMDFHLRGLVETLRLGSVMDDVIETMIVIYLEGGTGLFWPFFRDTLPGGEDDEAGYAAFEETMVTARNVGMAAGAVPFLERGGAFVAVGALHLPGDAGMVELLRREGWTLSPVE